MLSYENCERHRVTSTIGVAPGATKTVIASQPIFRK
jgi:hypothetical protein